jgi:Tfp pilus assembly protein PilF
MGKYGDLYTTSFEIVGQIVDDGGRVVHSIFENIEVELQPIQFEQVKRFPFGFEDRIPLLPGSYTMHLIVKNDPQKEVGLLDASFTIPEAGGGAPVLQGLTLGYLESERGTAAGSVQPFQIGGKKVFPAIGHRFGKSDAIRVFAQLRLPEDADNGSIRIRCRVYEGASTVVEEEIPLSELVDLGGGLSLVHKTVRVPGMPAGKYRLALQVEDGTGKLSAAAQQEFTVEGLKTVPRPWIKTKTYAGAASDYYHIALQHVKKGEYGEATRNLEASLGADPDFLGAKLKLAGLYLTANRFEDVLRICEPVFFQDPENTDAALHLAVAYSGLKKYAKAVKLYERVTAGGVETDSILNAMAEAYYNAGDIDRAIEILRKSLALYPSQPRIQEFLKRLEENKG